MDKKPLSLQEIQQVELHLLKEFDAICRKHSLRYSLGGGTLLGAVRHKGFIPWDDDIDVMMPRPDYEAFLRLCKTEQMPFLYHTFEDDNQYRSLSAKITDPKTEIRDEFSNTKDGVFIDVFPIDGLGTSEESALNVFRSTSFQRELLNAVAWDRFVRSKSRPLWQEPVRYAFFLLSRLVNPQKLLQKTDLASRRYDFETSSYAGCVCGSYREKEIMEQLVFTSYTQVPFEGNRFMAIKDYDAYLTKHYGDYMQLPPKEKQKSHHSFQVFWK